MGLVDKYPYTNFAGINLDYYIKMVNEVAADIENINTELDVISKYVKNVEIINSAALKITFGDNNVKTFALPSGNNFVIDIIQPDAETTAIDDLEVNGFEEYDTNLTDYRVFADMLFAGVPSVARIVSYLGTYTGITMIQANWLPSIIVWDSDNSAWKVFTLEINNDCTIKVTRVY